LPIGDIPGVRLSVKFSLMLSRRAAYYGLLICLIALLALGTQPLRAGRQAMAQHGSSQDAPEQDGDEEEEVEEESEVPLLRRKVLIWHHVGGESLLTRAEVALSPRRFAPSPTPSGNSELTARNGIGGPLHL